MRPLAAGAPGAAWAAGIRLERSLVLLARVRRDGRAARARCPGRRRAAAGVVAATAAARRAAASPAARSREARPRTRRWSRSAQSGCGSAPSCSGSAARTGRAGAAGARGAEQRQLLSPRSTSPRVDERPAWLPADTVRALGLVPFEVDAADRRVHVICARRRCRARRVRALHKLTGWTAELVSRRTTTCGSGRCEAYRPSARDARDGERARRSAASTPPPRSWPRRHRPIARSRCGTRSGIGLRGCASRDRRQVSNLLVPGAWRAHARRRLQRTERHAVAARGLDRLAVDLANVSTAGYKTERTATLCGRARLRARCSSRPST